MSSKFLLVTGQSVGSGPTCHLGAKVPGLAGVILHSPLATGMRVMNPTWTRWPSWLDVFPNIKLISKINAPTLIMHVRFCGSQPLEDATPLLVQCKPSLQFGGGACKLWLCRHELYRA